MQSKPKKSTKTIKMSLLFAFIIIALLFLVTFTLHKNFNKIVMETILSYDNTLAQHVASTNANIDDLVNTAGAQIYFNPAIKKLRADSYITNFDAITGNRELSRALSFSSMIHSVYVYNPNNNYIYSTWGMAPSNSSDKFADDIAAEIFLNKEDITPVYREINIPSSESSVPVLTYSFGKNFSNPMSDGALLININMSWIEELYLSMSVVDGQLILLSEEHYPLAFTGTTAPTTEVIAQISGEQSPPKKMSNMFYTSKKGEQMYFSAPIPYSGIKLYLIAPYEKLMKDISTLKRENFLSLTGLMVVVLLAVAVIMFALYRPYRKMLTTVSSVTDSENMDDILLELDRWAENAAENSEYHEHYLNTLRTEFLRSLLKGSSPGEDSMIKSFATFNISFDLNQDFYLLLTDCAGKYIETCLEVAENWRMEDDVIEWLTDEDKCLAIIQTAVPFRLNTLAERLYTQTKHNVYISSEILIYQNIKVSYTRLREVRLFSKFYPEKTIFFESMLDLKSKNSNYPFQLEKEIIAHLRHSRLEEAIVCYREMIGVILGYRYSNFSFALKRLYLSIRSLYQSKTDSSKEVDSADLYSFSIAVEEAATASEVDEIFINLFKVLAEQKDNNRQQEIIDEIKMLVKHFYKDAQLNMHFLADKLNLSADYISRVFRNGEQETINDYILKLRMEKACALLVETQNPVKEISKSVGINNDRYFFTLFKNHTGLTPNEYRTNNG